MVEAAEPPEEVGVAKADTISSQSSLLLLLLLELLPEPSLASSFPDMVACLWSCVLWCATSCLMLSSLNVRLNPKMPVGVLSRKTKKRKTLHPLRKEEKHRPDIHSYSHSLKKDKYRKEKNGKEMTLCVLDPLMMC